MKLGHSRGLKEFLQKHVLAYHYQPTHDSKHGGAKHQTHPERERLAHTKRADPPAAQRRPGNSSALTKAIGDLANQLGVDLFLIAIAHNHFHCAVEKLGIDGTQADKASGDMRRRTKR